MIPVLSFLVLYLCQTNTKMWSAEVLSASSARERHPESQLISQLILKTSLNFLLLSHRLCNFSASARQRMLKEEYQTVSTVVNLLSTITQMHGLGWCAKSCAQPDQKVQLWAAPVTTHRHKCTGGQAQTQHLSASSTQHYQICYLQIQIIYNHSASSVLVSRASAGKELYALAMQAVNVLFSGMPCSLCRRGNVQLPNSSSPCLWKVQCVYQALGDCCQEAGTCWLSAFLWA